MRPTFSIESILGTRSKIAVLRVLVGVSVPLNATQIARQAQLTRPAVANVLAELAEAGVVETSSVGRANAHWLNRESAYVQEMVLPAFSAMGRIPELMRAELQAFYEPDALAIAIFGSYARDEQTAASDVDVVVVVADQATKDAVEEREGAYLTRFHQRFGAPLSVMVYTTREAADLEFRAPALAAELAQDAIALAGPRPWEWSRTWGSQGQ